MVASLISFVALHPEQATGLFWILFVLFSSAARALPAPVQNGNLFYTWFYTALHIFGANWDKVTSALCLVFPALKMFGIGPSTIK